MKSQWGGFVTKLTNSGRRVQTSPPYTHWSHLLCTSPLEEAKEMKVKEETEGWEGAEQIWGLMYKDELGFHPKNDAQTALSIPKYSNRTSKGFISGIRQINISIYLAGQRIPYKTLQSAKDKGGLSLPNIKSYCLGLGLVNFLKDSNLLIKVSIKIWHRIIPENKAKEPYWIIKWIGYDSDFPSNKMDTRFKHWADRRLIKHNDLYGRGTMWQFQDLKNVGETNQDFYRFLLLRH